MQRTAQFLIAVIVACGQTAVAQQLRGTVHDSTAATPLPGAVVSIVDSSGAAAARTIADGLGRFTLPLSSRSARVRVIRIGYQPRDVALPPGPSPSLAIVMVRLPAMLNVVRVSGEELCPGSVDRGPAFQLWEQARAGLLAAVVAREANPSMTTSLLFKRQVSPGNGLVAHQETRVGTGRTTRPFVAAASSAAFAATGYMREDATGRTFFAPDADVLLDESFATAHCFHLQPADDAHPAQIGLAFTPARNREAVVDVRGVIWMDRGTPAIRSLDFRYTELEPVSVSAGAGGHIEFRDVQNGVSFIERWMLRVPIAIPIRAATTFARPGTTLAAPRRQDRVDLRVSMIDETGGMVLAAKWPDGTSWQAPPTGVAGDVTQSGSGEPSRHAVLTLAGTADTVTADERGAFTMTPVLPGRYLLSANDTALLAFASPRSATREIEIARDRVSQVRLQVAPMLAVLGDLCAGRRIPRSSTTIVGRVVLPDGRAVRYAKVRGTWQADYNDGGPVSSGGQVTVNVAEQTSDGDDRGRFVLCGVATGRPVRLHLMDGTLYPDTTIVASEGSVASIEWRLRPQAAVGEEKTGTLTGIVSIDGSGAPAAGAEVSVSPIGRSVLTGADGVFQFSSLPTGSYALQVRRIGYAVIVDTVRVDAGPGVRRSYGLIRATQLDTVRAVAAERRFISPALRAFEERRKGGSGSFIADSVLRANDDSRLGDVLRSRAPGIRILADRSATYAASARDSRTGKYAILPGGSTCYVTMYLDGVKLFDNENGTQGNPPPNLNDFSVNQLGAVEFYAGGATVPLQFKASACGVLLLWSREK